MWLCRTLGHDQEGGETQEVLHTVLYLLLDSREREVSNTILGQISPIYTTHPSLHPRRTWDPHFIYRIASTNSACEIYFAQRGICFCLDLAVPLIEPCIHTCIYQPVFVLFLKCNKSRVILVRISYLCHFDRAFLDSRPFGG